MVYLVSAKINFKFDFGCEGFFATLSLLNYQTLFTSNTSFCYPIFCFLFVFFFFFFFLGGEGLMSWNVVFYCFKINKIVLMLYPDKTCLLGSNTYEIVNAQIQIIFLFSFLLKKIKNWHYFFQCIAAVIFHTILHMAKPWTTSLSQKHVRLLL